MNIETLRHELSIEKTARQTAEKRLAEIAEHNSRFNAAINKIREVATTLKENVPVVEQRDQLQQIRTITDYLANEIVKITNDSNDKMEHSPSNDRNEKKTALKNKQVLLVEDDEIISIIGTNILKRNGATVTLAVNGKIATELAAEHVYDLILMDMQMPIMNGFDATRNIRNTHNKGVPIIGLTAHAIKSDDNSYYEAGMNDVIRKPYNEERLMAVINKWVAGAEIGQTIDRDGQMAPTPALYSLDKLLSLDDQDFITRMLGLFVDQIPTAVSQIRKAYDAGDFETIKYTAHRIRPAILNMGIESLKTEVMDIELLAGKGEKTTALDEMIQKMENVVSAVVASIRATHLR
jgi:CheY-like chemotaxis protein/HPt (histidine-containing phosphotransfer) domain-containing protein